MNTTRPFCLLLALASAGMLAAEIVDRVAIAVGNRVITASDLERDIRVAAFLNGTKPEFTPSERHASADRLTDQLLIRIELENSGYKLPDAQEVEPSIEELKKRFEGAPAFEEALKQSGITQQQLTDALIWQRAFLLFVGERFRPAVQVDEKEITEYFATVVAPKARVARPEQEPTLEEFRAQIEEAIAGKRVDEELNKWLQAKRRMRMLIFPEVFQ